VKRASFDAKQGAELPSIKMQGSSRMIFRKMPAAQITPSPQEACMPRLARSGLRYRRPAYTPIA
jgi:hypothetical protein